MLHKVLLIPMTTVEQLLKVTGEQKRLSWEEGSFPSRLKSREKRREKFERYFNSKEGSLPWQLAHVRKAVETVTQKHFIRVKLTIKFLNSTTAWRYSGEICKNGIQTKSKTISLNTKIIYFNIDLNIPKLNIFKSGTSV